MMTTSRVAGRIVDMNERAPKDIEVGLTIAGATNPSGTQRARVSADGAFEFPAVAPGRYCYRPAHCRRNWRPRPSDDRNR